MQKIPSVFCRNYDGDHRVRDEVVAGSEWVLAGEGCPTVKFDGTACMFRAGVLYKRFDAKKGKTPPAGFEPCQDPDPATGHWPGWIPVLEGNPADKWALEALTKKVNAGGVSEGTYELCGPKINGNPEGLASHELLRHGSCVVITTRKLTSFPEIRELLEEMPIEGIVWHHVDGRMAKIKRKDFGLQWPSKERLR